MRADGCEHVARYQNTLAATGAMALMNHLEGSGIRPSTSAKSCRPAIGAGSTSKAVMCPAQSSLGDNVLFTLTILMKEASNVRHWGSGGSASCFDDHTGPMAHQNSRTLREGLGLLSTSGDRYPSAYWQ